MFFSSTTAIREKNPEETVFDTLSLATRYQPELTEYAGASAMQALDRSSGARIWENIQLGSAASGSDKRYATEQDWKESPNYRPGVEFTPNMSEAAAAMLAENFDKRRKREAIIRGGDEYGSSWLYAPVGFGAGLVGSIPDPVNLIPGGIGVKGLGLAGMTAKNIFKKSIVPGLVSGGGANFLSSAYAAYDLNPKGEDITYQDVMLDTMFGAVLGIGFHTGGALLGRRKTRSAMRSMFSDMDRGLTDTHIEGVEIKKALEAFKKNEPEAYAMYGKQLESVMPQFDGYNQAIDFWRGRVTTEERVKIAQAMETALTQSNQGGKISAGEVLRKSNAEASVINAVNSFQKYQAEDFSALRQTTEQRLTEVNNRLSQAEASVRVGEELVNTSEAAAVSARSTIGMPRQDYDFVRRTARYARRASEAARRELTTLQNEKAALERRLTDLDASASKFAETKSIEEALESSRLAMKAVDDIRAELAQARAGKVTPSQKKKISSLEKRLARAQKDLDTASTVIERFQQLEETKASLDRVDWTEVDPDAFTPEVREQVADVVIDKDGVSMEEKILRDEKLLTPEDQATLEAYTLEASNYDKLKGAARFIASCVMGH